MTERKPSDMSFTTWIDKQINEAAERGEFDNLPGAGRPLPKHGDEDAHQAWLREYVRREGLSSEEMLPAPLKLRKQAERLAAAAPGLPSEQAVRDAASELNERIMEWRRIPLGPPIFVPLVNTEELVASWHAARSAEPASAGTATAGLPPARPRAARSRPARSRWWRRNSPR
jgi:Domain of unknown function (DUF1992)